MNVTSNLTIGTAPSTYQALYRCLFDDANEADRQAAWLLAQRLAQVDVDATDLPSDFTRLAAWMNERHQRIGEQYQLYLKQRAQGAPRHYFSCRAQAMYFLRCIAPTKLVDGAWLYGLTRYWYERRLEPLLRTYLEELGEGQADKNHVLIYQRLLARYGCDHLQDLPDDCYLQGALQLALGRKTEHLMPEVLGFNLGYEQLPLHLLITANELAELDIDPYYFTLHVTIDNLDVGHARKARQSVLDTMPTQAAARDQFYQRVRRGYALNDCGPDVASLLRRFNLEHEVRRVLQRKAIVGHHMHSDHCYLGGRRLNDWLGDLASSDTSLAFLNALQRHGWVRRGEPAANSRFWTLIKGERASMFGIFNGYERQVIHDWIVADSLPDERRYRPSRRPGHPAEADRAQTTPGIDHDVRHLEKQLAEFDDPCQKMSLLSGLIGPKQHFTPAGLLATRRFAEHLERL